MLLPAARRGAAADGETAAVAVRDQDRPHLAGLAVGHRQRRQEGHVAQLEGRRAGCRGRAAAAGHGTERGARHLEVSGARHHRVAAQAVLVEHPGRVGAQAGDEDLFASGAVPGRGAAAEQRMREAGLALHQLPRAGAGRIATGRAAGHADAAPGVPIDRRHRPAAGAGARLGERAEEGVGRRVVGLAGAAEDGVERGAKDEAIQILAGQQLGEHEGTIHFGGEHRRAPPAATAAAPVRRRRRLPRG